MATSSAVEALRPSYAAVIVGGRCAGAATAMLLARAGVDVLVVEQDARGADTLSTLAMMRAGVLQLFRWGLLDAIRAAGTPRIEATTFHYGSEKIEIRIKPRDGVDGLYAPRRTVLDPLIADAAAAAGAHVVYRMRLKELTRDASGRVTGAIVESGGVAREIGATIVIGADGFHSTVASRVGAEPYHAGLHKGGVIYTRVRGLPNTGYHWHYAPGMSIGVIPTNDETLIFAATTSDRFMRELRFDMAAGFDTLVRATSPALAEALVGAERSPYHGFAGHPGRLRQSWGPGWALVGDAGYFKDPITAHGITDALRDAELVARAVVIGTDAALAEYQAVRDRLSLGLFTITDEIASFAWDMPRLQVLHKSLSEEMTREVLHVSSGGAEGAPDGDAHGGARSPLQPDHGRSQSASH
ncbi:MAG TPA: FAD-dependent monooxygenase [Vicinamibacterales bacterium]|nr:FAD-dependent monooxygenase [Vicinamibacterales bacterium]